MNLCNQLKLAPFSCTSMFKVGSRNALGMLPIIILICYLIFMFFVVNRTAHRNPWSVVAERTVVNNTPGSHRGLPVIMTPSRIPLRNDNDYNHKLDDSAALSNLVCGKDYAAELVSRPWGSSAVSAGFCPGVSSSRAWEGRSRTYASSPSARTTKRKIEIRALLM